MKFRFCGGLEPPDWLLAELPLLSGEQSIVRPKHLCAMCEAIGVDIAVQELDQAHQLFKEAQDAKAAVAVLRFILTHAAKYNVERADLVEELEQLGMHFSATEAIAQSYEGLRECIHDQQRSQSFKVGNTTFSRIFTVSSIHGMQFPSIENVEWQVKDSSKVTLNMTLDQPVMECDRGVVPTTRNLCLDMTRDKFLALYEELSQAQSLLQELRT